MLLERSLSLVAPSRGRRSRNRWRLGDKALRAVGAVTTPLLPADYLDLFDPLRGGADLRGRVRGVRRETASAVTVLIEPGRSWRGHVPGQYVRIGLDVKGVRRWRAYSLTSGPRADGCITITVKAIPDGVVSNHIVNHLRPGTVIQMDQATGDFTLPDPAPRKVLFVTAGSGITPVMGILRHRLAGGADHAQGEAQRDRDAHRPLSERRRRPDIAIIHSAPTEADVIFGRELWSLAEAGLVSLHVRPTDTQGMLATADLASLVPDWHDRQTWACGPTGMLDALEAHWAAEGDPTTLHTERFRPHVVITGEGGEVTFERAGRTASADGGTPLLEVGEKAGVLMRSGCRMGICYGCVVPLRHGAVRDLRNGTITQAVPGDPVIIQTCISAAAGECHLDA